MTARNEGVHVGPVAGKSVRHPGGICREVFYRLKRFILAQQAFRKGTQIEPFQMRALQVVYRMIEIEAVNISDDSAHPLIMNDKGRSAKPRPV
jgi:hypothetical protein